MEWAGVDKVHMASRFDPQIIRKKHQLEHTDSSCRTSARKVDRWLTELFEGGDQPSIALQINKTEKPVISDGPNRLDVDGSANKQSERYEERDGRINEKNDWRCGGEESHNDLNCVRANRA